MDVCVTASLCKDFITCGVEQPRYAASFAHARKVNQVGAACKADRIRFKPVGVENCCVTLSEIPPMTLMIE